MAIRETIPLPIAEGFYESRFSPVNTLKCVNAYPVITRTPSYEEQSIFGTPGIHQVATSGLTSSCRGGIEAKDKPYFVFGSYLYRVDFNGSTFTAVEVGDGLLGGGSMKMSQNGSQIMIVAPGIEGYVYTIATSTLNVITDSDFIANGKPLDVDYIDGYFVVTTDEDKVIVSDLRDGSSWNPLDFGSAEADPDQSIAVHVHQRNRMYVIGTETTQPFQNIGGADFPFQSVSGATVSVGTKSPDSIVETKNTFMMVGNDVNGTAAVWAWNGADYDKVSHEGIDYLLGQLTQSELEAITGWSYSDSGGHFVGFNLPDTTIVFDVSSGLWHERKTRYFDDFGAFSENSWRCRHPVRAYNRLLCGDVTDGRVGEISLDFYDEYGSEILRYAHTQPFHNKGNSFKVPFIEATMEAGRVSTDEDEPQVRLSFSRDYGKTFGPERSRSLGKVGERNKRQIWTKNGRMSKSTVVKVAFSDKAPFSITRLEAQFA